MKQRLKRWRDTSPLTEPVCRLVRATGFVPEGIWRHLAFSGIADFTVAARRVRMRHFGAEIENSLFWAGYGAGWEATTLLAWERLAAEHEVIFDVGANTGLFALAAAAARPGARIHAFEPLPGIVERLRDNIALNGFAIAVHAVAVSDRDGTAQIQLAQSEHEYSASFEHMDWMDHAAVHTIEVPVVRLAQVIADSGDRPGLIKLDVERHEPQALRGLWAGLGDGPLPAMVVEILDDDCAAKVAQEIAGKGYDSYVIRESEGIAAAQLRFVPGTMNWLLLPVGADGFAARLREKQGISHRELLGSRPHGDRVRA
jgi:FkbM family methyltransferase